MASSMLQLLVLFAWCPLAADAINCCADFKSPRLPKHPGFRFEDFGLPPDFGPPPDFPNRNYNQMCPVSEPVCQGKCVFPPYGQPTYGTCTGKPVIGCSSSGAQDGYYPCESAFDDNVTSPWLAASKEEYTWIQAHFAQNITVDKLTFHHPQEHDHWIGAATLHFSDGTVQFITPAATDQVQSFALKPPVNTTYVKLVVESFQAGSSKAGIRGLVFFRQDGKGSVPVGPFLQGVQPPEDPPALCHWDGPSKSSGIRPSCGTCGCDYGESCGIACPKDAPKCWGSAGGIRACCEMVLEPAAVGFDCDADHGTTCGGPQSQDACCAQPSGTFATRACPKEKPFCVGLRCPGGSIEGCNNQLFSHVCASGLGPKLSKGGVWGRCYADPHPTPPAPPAPPATYLCVNSICTASVGGGTLAECKDVCKPGNGEAIV